MVRGRARGCWGRVMDQRLALGACTPQIAPPAPPPPTPTHPPGTGGRGGWGEWPVVGLCLIWLLAAAHRQPAPHWQAEAVGRTPLFVGERVQNSPLATTPCLPPLHALLFHPRLVPPPRYWLTLAWHHACTVCLLSHLPCLEVLNDPDPRMRLRLRREQSVGRGGARTPAPEAAPP